jgi:predicted dehydrogenase
MLKYAIVGCGLIGKKRAATLDSGSLAVACDLDSARAEALARLYPSTRVTADYNHAVEDPAVNAVIVSTLNSTLAPIALAAVQAGKHVLVEKPGAITSQEIAALREAARKQKVCVRVGYNHRFHPALSKARTLLDQGVAGPLMFIRARYGHGGRVGYDREWRSDPKLSGGGELLDQGVHLIDLARWFLGDFTTVEGHASTLYWDMPVDDNAFLSLRTAQNQTAWLQVSCSEWKNLFSFEIYGREAKLQVEGLGGSYGLERLTFYKMLPQMGPPETTIWEFPRGDESWALERQAFEEDIASGLPAETALQNAEEILKVVEKIYRDSGYPR